MPFKLEFSEEALLKLTKWEANKSKTDVLKQVRKTLGLMETNLKHSSLHTHKFDGIKSRLGAIFESYVQNNAQPLMEFFGYMGRIV